MHDTRFTKNAHVTGAIREVPHHVTPRDDEPREQFTARVMRERLAGSREQVKTRVVAGRVTQHRARVMTRHARLNTAHARGSTPHAGARSRGNE